MDRQRLFPVIAMAWATITGCTQEKPQLAVTRPQVVLVSQPVTREVTDFEDFTGRSDAVFSVEVRARVTGYLDKVLFEDGSEVKGGDLLFQIDPRPYEAALAAAEATVIQCEAHQRRLEADHRRATNLFTRGAISREEVDRIVGDYEEASAAVGIAKAQRDLTKLNLEFTKVTAPISGRTSRRLVDPGNLVQADQTALTTIVSLDPVYVYFDIDERTLLRLRRLIREGRIKSRTEAEVPVLVGLSDEEGYPHRGFINFSDNRVDPSTGTLRVRGVMPNPKPARGSFRFLSPGLFMRVRLPIGTPHPSILIDEQALGTDQGKKFLYVVNDRNEVVYRPVKIGSLNEGKRVIEEGLAPGEWVIVSGLQRVRPGVKVEPKSREDSLRASTEAPKPSGTPATAVATAAKKPTGD
ncbi:MAG: efflux RND transporter periplasmic adaptor subunit [Planctomycetaceae bacterium]|nr:efflux RND transporter periplasmic adaptor subunit [Planctomycetaceae bacterium]